MLPIRVLQLIHSPIRGHCGHLRLGGRVPTDRFSPSRASRLPVSSFQRGSLPPARCSASMASADFPGHFLPGISPDKSALLPGTTAAFTSVAEPTGFAVLCQLTTPRRPSMRLLFVGPPVSASLPPHARLPSRSWLHVVVLSRFHVLVLLQGTCTPFTTRPCWAFTRNWNRTQNGGHFETFSFNVLARRERFSMLDATLSI